MGKYEPLYAHLKNIKFNIWRVSFEEIEKILGFKLPVSARKYCAWWANQQNGSRAYNWIRAGYVTAQLDLKKEEITFIKGSPSFTSTGNKKLLPIPSSKQKQENIPWPWDEAEKSEAKLILNWQPFGKVTQNNDKLVFPNAMKISGLYRIRIINADMEARYIGESSNLRRRFGNYRNPSPSQKTSFRINNQLLKALNEGAEINIAIITKDASIIKSGQKIDCDFSNKATRVMFEHLAQVIGNNISIINLNK